MAQLMEELVGVERELDQRVLKAFSRYCPLVSSYVRLFEFVLLYFEQ